MTASRTDAGAAMPARKRVRAWVRDPGGSWLGERVIDVGHSWSALTALLDEGLIPDGDFDISVRQVMEGGDAG